MTVTVNISRDIARAEALGRLAAQAGASISTCPFPYATPHDRVLRARWAQAFTGAGGGMALTEPVGVEKSDSDDNTGALATFLFRMAQSSDPIVREQALAELEKFDPDQKRWPPGTPGGLGGRWMRATDIATAVAHGLEAAVSARLAESPKPNKPGVRKPRTPRKATASTVAPPAGSQQVAGGDFGGMTRVGPQAGSTPGGVFQAADNTRWYVKQQQDTDHANNEALAAALYRESGVDAPHVQVGSGTPGLPGKVHTAARMLDDPKPMDLNDPAARAAVREGFAVDAWLANWDVAGAGGDNILMSGGKPHRIDVGGALLYRARGEAKGNQFGKSVTEWDTLREGGANRSAAQLFEGITPDELAASADRVKRITPARIRALVRQHNMPESLAETLIARRTDLLKRAKAARSVKPTGRRVPPVAPPGVAREETGNVAAALNAGQLNFDTRRAIPGVSDAERKAVDLYASDAQRINRAVREGRTGSATVRNLDGVLGRSKTDRDIEVWRGSSASAVGVPDGDATSFEWDEKAFVSTSADRAIAAEFAHHPDYRDPVLMRVNVPAGTGAITVSGERGSQFGEGQAEVLLQRGLRMRVTRDHGLVDEPGMPTKVRRLDVEIVAAGEREPTSDTERKTETPGMYDYGAGPVRIVENAIRRVRDTDADTYSMAKIVSELQRGATDPEFEAIRFDRMAERESDPKVRDVFADTARKLRESAASPGYQQDTAIRREFEPRLQLFDSPDRSTVRSVLAMVQHGKLTDGEAAVRFRNHSANILSGRTNRRQRDFAGLVDDIANRLSERARDKSDGMLAQARQWHSEGKTAEAMYTLGLAEKTDPERQDLWTAVRADFSTPGGERKPTAAPARTRTRRGGVNDEPPGGWTEADRLETPVRITPPKVTEPAPVKLTNAQSRMLERLAVRRAAPTTDVEFKDAKARDVLRRNGLIDVHRGVMQVTPRGRQWLDADRKSRTVDGLEVRRSTIRPSEWEMVFHHADGTTTSDRFSTRGGAEARRDEVLEFRRKEDDWRAEESSLFGVPVRPRGEVEANAANTKEFQDGMTFVLFGKNHRLDITERIDKRGWLTAGGSRSEVRLPRNQADAAGMRDLYFMAGREFMSDFGASIASRLKIKDPPKVVIGDLGPGGISSYNRDRNEVVVDWRLLQINPKYARLAIADGLAESTGKPRKDQQSAVRRVFADADQLRRELPKELAEPRIWNGNTREGIPADQVPDGSYGQVMGVDRNGEPVSATGYMRRVPVPAVPGQGDKPGHQFEVTQTPDGSGGWRATVFIPDSSTVDVRISPETVSRISRQEHRNPIGRYALAPNFETAEQAGANIELVGPFAFNGGLVGELSDPLKVAVDLRDIQEKLKIGSMRTPDAYQRIRRLATSYPYGSADRETMLRLADQMFTHNKDTRWRHQIRGDVLARRAEIVANMTPEEREQAQAEKRIDETSKQARSLLESGHSDAGVQLMRAAVATAATPYEQERAAEAFNRVHEEAHPYPPQMKMPTSHLISQNGWLIDWAANRKNPDGSRTEVYRSGNNTLTVTGDRQLDSAHLNGVRLTPAEYRDVAAGKATPADDFATSGRLNPTTPLRGRGARDRIDAAMSAFTSTRINQARDFAAYEALTDADFAVMTRLELDAIRAGARRLYTNIRTRYQRGNARGLEYDRARRLYERVADAVKPKPASAPVPVEREAPKPAITLPTFTDVGTQPDGSKYLQELRWAFPRNASKPVVRRFDEAARRFELAIGTDREDSERKRLADIRLSMGIVAAGDEKRKAMRAALDEAAGNSGYVPQVQPELDAVGAAAFDLSLARQAAVHTGTTADEDAKRARVAELESALTRAREAFEIAARRVPVSDRGSVTEARVKELLDATEPVAPTWESDPNVLRAAQALRDAEIEHTYARMRVLRGGERGLEGAAARDRLTAAQQELPKRRQALEQAREAVDEKQKADLKEVSKRLQNVTGAYPHVVTIGDDAARAERKNLGVPGKARFAALPAEQQYAANTAAEAADSIAVFEARDAYDQRALAAINAELAQGNHPEHVADKLHELAATYRQRLAESASRLPVLRRELEDARARWAAAAPPTKPRAVARPRTAARVVEAPAQTVERLRGAATTDEVRSIVGGMTKPQLLDVAAAAGITSSQLPRDRKDRIIRRIEERLLGVPDSFARPANLSTKPLLPNRWGTPSEVAFHPDSRVGDILRGMSGNDQRINVDGEPLANVLGRMATDVARGRKSSQQLIDDLRELSRQLPDGSEARNRIRRGADAIDTPMLSATLPESVPQPLRTLIERLSHIPLARHRRDGRDSEFDKAVEIARQFEAGEVGGVRLLGAVERLLNQQHESQEGKFEIDAAVNDARQELRDLVQRNPAALRPPTAEPAREREAGSAQSGRPVQTDIMGGETVVRPERRAPVEPARPAEQLQLIDTSQARQLPGQTSLLDELGELREENLPEAPAVSAPSAQTPRRLKGFPESGSLLTGPQVEQGREFARNQPDWQARRLANRWVDLLELDATRENLRDANAVEWELFQHLFQKAKTDREKYQPAIDRLLVTNARIERVRGARGTSRAIRLAQAADPVLSTITPSEVYVLGLEDPRTGFQDTRDYVRERLTEYRTTGKILPPRRVLEY